MKIEYSPLKKFTHLIGKTLKFNKDFIGDIITENANQGEVTYVNTPNIYGVGAVNKRIEKLIFTGNRAHNLHNNIYAAQVNFDAGTYNIHTNPVTIDGNANINGSTFNLNHNLIFTGDVAFSNNITLNAAAGTGLIFQNNAPVAAAATNIIITVNGAPPVDAAAALALFTVNGGAFAPVGHNYDAGTGTLALPIDAQAQAQAQAAAQAQALAEQQRLDAQAAAQAQQNQQGQGQGKAQQQQQEQAQQDQPQAQVGQEDNVRGEQAPLQTQQRIVEVVPQPRPEPANVIASVASSTAPQEVRVIQAQKEVIREKSALVMKNPEKHAVELAKELVNNQAELKEAVKVASDDAAIKSKTKQEQSLLFVANLANAAQGTPNKG